MKKKSICAIATVALSALALVQPAHADENLLGYVRGAEVLPKGALEAYQPRSGSYPVPAGPTGGAEAVSVGAMSSLT